MKKLAIICAAAFAIFYVFVLITAKDDSVWVFDSTASGGCLRANMCGNFTLYDNGEFVGAIGKANRKVGPRKGASTGPVVYQGQIDPGVFDAWTAIAVKTDYKTMLAALETGRSLSATDGIDREYSVKFDGRILKVFSTKYRFDQAVPFFKQSKALVADMQKQTLSKGVTRANVQVN